jgi:transposase
VLLAADAGRSDGTIAATLGVSAATIYRIKRRCVEGGGARAHRRPAPGGSTQAVGQRRGAPRGGRALQAAGGRPRWTLELLAGELVRLTAHEHLSRETVRRRLQEKALKPWQKKMCCIPAVDAEFVARMEDVLDLYATTPPRTMPVVCFDETPVQLIGEKRAPLSPEPGHPRRYDYEYRRHGTANLFVSLDAHCPWRQVKVTARRTAREFVECMRDLHGEEGALYGDQARRTGRSSRPKACATG